MRSTNEAEMEQHGSETIRKTLCSVLAVGLGLLLADHAQAATKTTKITTCPVFITASGVYAVTKDLTCSVTAITISASNVDLNLGGHSISGSGSGVGIDVKGGCGVSIRQGNVQGFEIGILLNGTRASKLSNLAVSGNIFQGINLQSAQDCKLNNVTASGSVFDGILLSFGSTGNTVTSSTVTQNGDTGIRVNGASSGNTMVRNTADRNGSGGISLEDDSYGNSVVHNSAGQNGQGIRLIFGATQNTVQDNTASGNYLGISVGFGGASRNSIQSNTANLNILGIWLDLGGTSNSIQGNTALTNRDSDLGDQNPGCDSNAWTNNHFVTDNVAGASDGGPGAGCIQ